MSRRVRLGSQIVKGGIGIIPDVRADIGDALDRVEDRFDDILDATQERPRIVFEVAPAFEDFALLGQDDPGPRLVGVLQPLVDALAPGAELVSVAAGVAPTEEQIAAGEDAIGLALLVGRRRQVLGIYPRPGVQQLRERGCREVDLGTIDRLAGVRPEDPFLPFALRVEYAGIEDVVRSTLAPVGNRMSHTFAPCACGPIQVDAVDVEQLRIAIGGGGGLGAPSSPPSQTTAVPVVVTRLSCRVADVGDITFAFDVLLQEAIEIAEVRGVDKLSVTPDVDVVVRTLTGGDLPERVDELAKGSTGQRLLAQLLRPANRLVKRTRQVVGDQLERLAPDVVLGLFGEIAAGLGPDVLLERPAPFEGPLQKVVLRIAGRTVGATAVELRGEARVVERTPLAGFVGTTVFGGDDRQVVQAVTLDLRSPTFRWTTSTGTIVGDADRTTVRVEYPPGADHQLTLAVTHPDAPPDQPLVAASNDFRPLVPVLAPT